jgi:hypothetical protein
VLRRDQRAAAQSAAQASPHELEQLRRHAGQRVLLVDDNPVNQEVAGELLSAAGLVVDKVHPRAARVIKEYMGAAAAEQILVRSKTTGVRQQVKCIIDGGVAKVFVATAKEFYSGVYAATLTERETIVVVRTFSISRADTLSTVPDHPTKLLKTNNATFLGLSAGKVMYLSTDAVTNIAGAGPYPMQFAHSFLYLSIGHILDIDGWLDEIVTEEDVSGAPAWFTASDLGVTATIPSQTDFSVFLT